METKTFIEVFTKDGQNYRYITGTLESAAFLRMVLAECKDVSFVTLRCESKFR